MAQQDRSAGRPRAAAVALLGLLWLTGAPAAPANLPGRVIPVQAWVMLADAARNRLYLSEMKANDLAVVDALTGDVVQRLPCGSAPNGMAMSPDGSTLYIGLSGGSQIAVLDLAKLTFLEPLQLDFPPANLACPEPERLYVTGGGQGNWEPFRVVHPRTNVCRPGGMLYSNALVVAQPGAGRVFIAETGISPSSVRAMPVAADPAKAGPEAPVGVTGGNLQDMKLSPDGKRLYVCCGAPYYVQVFDTESLASVGQLACGAYPSHVAIAPDNARAYVVHARDHIDVFDTATFRPLGAISIPGEAGALLITPDGKKLAAMCNVGLWLVDLADLTLSPPGR